MEKWVRSGRPAHPGRLCDLCTLCIALRMIGMLVRHWSVRNLANDKLLKENVDGEAVAWAAGRLRNRHEARKILVVVSDGAPVDDLLARNDGRGFSVGISRTLSLRSTIRRPFGWQRLDWTMMRPITTQIICR